MKASLSIILLLSFALTAFGQNSTPLAYRLDTILNDDQKYRLKIDSIKKKYGDNSTEMKTLWDTIKKLDSINLMKVEAIIDKYGWVGVDSVGVNGNMALWLVIQHSDLKTQEKYLPIMKEAVKKGNAMASHLALLEDRIEVRHGRPQIYGSQVGYKDGKPTFEPIIDEKNVDKRRAEVGLEPLEDYAKHFGFDFTR